MAKPARLSLALVAVVALAACGGNGGGGAKKAGGSAASKCHVSGKHVSFPLLTNATTHSVRVKTNLGTFAFMLDVKDSPCTASSFAHLARTKFFDGLIFHRIVPGFVIQGGDPKGNGTGGPGYSVVDTPPADAKYTRGVVAMAKTSSEPAGTSGSQFFVVTGADVGLPPDYALLGKVSQGLDVVERIGKLGNAAEQPTRRVVIQKMTVSP